MKHSRSITWFFIAIVFFALLVLNGNALSATTSGSLIEDEIWNGTVEITGDIPVPEGIALTIEAGSQIIFPNKEDETSNGYFSAEIENRALKEKNETKLHININSNRHISNFIYFGC